MDIIGFASLLCVPGFVLLCISSGLKHKVKVFDAFVAGAKGGIGIAFKIMPYVIGMIFAVDIFKASGCFDYISYGIASLLGDAFPAEIIPLALIRPFSGGAATGILIGIFNTAGPDSFAGRSASIMMGSSETMFYTVSLYYGSIGVTKTRHTIPAALVSEITGVVCAVLICNIML